MRKCTGNLFIYFPISVLSGRVRTISNEKRICLNEFGLIENFIVTAEADVEFTSKLTARGFSDTQISELEKPSLMLSSMEDYVRNVFRR